MKHRWMAWVLAASLVAAESWAQQGQEEATRLEAQVARLSQQGKVDEAIAMAQRAIAIRDGAGLSDDPSTAVALHVLANLHQAKGNLGEFEALLKRSIAIFERSLGPDHPYTAIAVRGMGEFYWSLGKYKESEALLRRALTIQKATIGLEHPDTAITLRSLASLYSTQGKTQEVETLLKQSLIILEKMLGPEHVEVSFTLKALADNRFERGDIPGAELAIKRVIAIQEKTLGPEEPRTVLSLLSLARIYLAQGRFGQAQDTIVKVIDTHSRQLGPEHALVLSDLAMLSLLRFSQGKFSEAEALSQRTLTISEKTLGPDHPTTLSSLMDLAGIYMNQGKLDEARSLYERALTAYKASLGARHQSVARVMGRLADVARWQGRYEESRSLYLGTMEIYELTLGPDHPLVSTVLDGLATLSLNEGKYKEAEPLLKRAISIQEKTFGADSVFVTSAMSALGSAYLMQQKYAEAEGLYRQALAIAEKAVGADHQDVAVLRFELASIHEGQGHIKEAIALQTIAQNTMERILSVQLSSGAEHSRLLFLSRFKRYTYGAISLHTRSASSSADALALAFTTVLERKGRVLEASADSFRSLRSSLTPSSQSLLDQLRELRSRQASLSLQGPGSSPPEEHLASLRGLDQQANQLEASISQESAVFAATSQPITLERVQRALPTRSALVEFFVYHPFDPRVRQGGESWGMARYVAYVLPAQGEPRWADLGETREIDPLVARFRQAVVKGSDDDTRALSQQVFARVMAPVLPLVSNSKHLLLSPDGALHLLPFAALQDGEGHYLSERVLLSHVGSGRDVLRWQAKVPSRSGPLLIAAPDYDGQGKTREHEDGTRTSRAMAGVKFTPLPATATEAKAIARLLPDATTYTGAQATEAVLLGAQAPRILHIATHGFFLEDTTRTATAAQRGLTLEMVGPRPPLPENPLLRSGLALAGANRKGEGEQDGILTALEASQLNLYGTKLVVLSACETGLGEVKGGDSVYGLSRALVLAGAETQVTSLWQVDDEATQRLMTSYYRRLGEGQGRSEAMRTVQREMQQDKATASPFFWAGFVVSGDPSTMDGKPVEVTEPVSTHAMTVKPGGHACGCEVPAGAGGAGWWGAGLLAGAMVARRRRGKLVESV